MIGRYFGPRNFHTVVDRGLDGGDGSEESDGSLKWVDAFFFFFVSFSMIVETITARQDLSREGDSVVLHSIGNRSY